MLHPMFDKITFIMVSRSGQMLRYVIDRHEFGENCQYYIQILQIYWFFVEFCRFFSILKVSGYVGNICRFSPPSIHLSENIFGHTPRPKIRKQGTFDMNVKINAEGSMKIDTCFTRKNLTFKTTLLIIQSRNSLRPCRSIYLCVLCVYNTFLYV